VHSDVFARLRETYLANLAALYRRDAVLAAQIDALPFGDLPRPAPTRDGRFTVKLTADDQREIYVHSRYRPVEEAEKFVDNLPAVENPSFFLNGLGLGYHVPAFERRYDGLVLIVAEDDPRMIKAALCLHDMSKLIGAGRLIFITEPESRVLHRKLTACNANVLLGLQIATLPHTARWHAEFHEQTRRVLADFVAVARTQMVTLLKTARVTFKNVAMNLSAYLENRGVEALRGRAAGFPAVVTAAGPSLARNLDQLGALRERAVVISVQTVLRLLDSLDLTPHFVTSLDYHAISTEFFRDIDSFDDCVLVAEPKAAWSVLDMYDAGKHVLRHKYHGALLQEVEPPRGELRPGTTVAHLAFYLAQHLGCDPIIFIGQDLSYSEGMFYMPGSPIEKIWAPEFNRFQTVEMKQWERIVRNRPILRTTRDMHGRDTYNDELLFTYREQFEHDFFAAPQRIIQASEGGVPLAGAEIMPLRDAARRYCTRPLPRNLFAETADPDAQLQKQRACEALEKRIEELKHVHKTAREMRGLLEKLDTLVEKPAQFNRLIARVDALRTFIHRYDHMYRLVIDVSAAAELRRMAADRDIGAPETETAKTARQHLKRDMEFVDSFLDGCEFLTDVIPEALNRIRERL